MIKQFLYVARAVLVDIRILPGRKSFTLFYSASPFVAEGIIAVIFIVNTPEYQCVLLYFLGRACRSQ